METSIIENLFKDADVHDTTKKVVLSYHMFLTQYFENKEDDISKKKFYEILISIQALLTNMMQLASNTEKGTSYIMAVLDDYTRLTQKITELKELMVMVLSKKDNKIGRC